jgi:hypothetical protein
MATEEEIDFLEVDRPIPGQNYVCLSFISPEKILENKNLYILYKFHMSMNEGCDLTFDNFKEKYDDFGEQNEDVIQKEFDLISDFQTNVRSVKIRGIYDSQREANVRAQVLQKMDNSFHVYVAQVGYWLPWDPNPNKIVDQEYLNNDLNRLNKEYNKNQTKKDMFYEEQKREKKMSAIRDSEEKKRKNLEEKEAVNNVNVSNNIETAAAAVDAAAPQGEPVAVAAAAAAPQGEPVAADAVAAVAADASQGEPVEENLSMNIETPETIVHDGETVGGEKTLEQALNDVDPWMARKMEEELEKK